MTLTLMRWDLTVRSRLTAAVRMAVPLPRGPGTWDAHKNVSALGNMSTSKHYFAENDVKV